MAGSQGGYTVTWGTINASIDTNIATAYVILNYYDGTNSVYDDDQKIYSLRGNTYEGVLSIEMCAECHGAVCYFEGQIAGSLEAHECVGFDGFYDFVTEQKFYCIGSATIYLGDDLEITNFDIFAFD